MLKRKAKRISLKQSREGDEIGRRWRTLCLLLAFTVLSWATGKAEGSVSQALKVLPQPAEAEVIGFEKAHCINVDPDTRICKAIGDQGAVIAVERIGVIVGEWAVDCYLGDTSDFEVLQGDLDNDGSQELVVANHDGTSNGIGERHWTIAILPLQFQGQFQQPLNFSVEEYGRNGTFIRNASTGKIDILAGFWLFTSKSYGSRGPGTYFCGRWFNYSKGELIPIDGQPILVRRYLFSFERERWANIDSLDIPFSWLSNKRTEKWNFDPSIDSSPALIKTGTVIEAEQLHQSQGIEGTSGTVPSILVKVQLEDGTTIRIANTVRKDYQATDVFDSIGNLESGRLYPENYIFAAGYNRLKGRRVKIIQYGNNDDENSKFVVLWI